MESYAGVEEIEMASLVERVEALEQAMALLSGSVQRAIKSAESLPREAAKHGASKSAVARLRSQVRQFKAEAGAVVDQYTPPP